MPRLSSISLENVRTFKDEARFEIKPLTIFCGPNSSGKSSVVQSLLLLKESCITERARRIDQPLEIFNYLDFDKAHGFDDYQALHSRGSKDERVSFRLGVHGAFGKTLPGPFSADQGVFLPDSESFKHGDVYADEASVSVDWPAKIEIELSFCERRLRRAAIRDTELDSGTDVISFEVVKAEAHPMSHLNEKTLVDSYTDLGWFIDCVLNSEYGKSLSDYEKRIITSISGKYSDRFGIDERDHIDVPVFGLNQIYARALAPSSQIFNKIEYIGNKRIKENIRLLIKRAVQNIIIVLNGISKVGYEYGQNSDKASSYMSSIYKNLKEGNEEGSSMYLSHPWLNEWVKYFGIGERLDYNVINKSRFEIYILRDGKHIPESDIGSGHRRILEMMAHLTYGMFEDSPASKGDITLIEEPEAHLHPNLQSRLADFFAGMTSVVSYRRFAWPWAADADFIKESKKNPPLARSSSVVLETHSEYIIRRLQYLVACGKADPEKIVIYYFPDRLQSQEAVKEITIAPSGKLSESFGPGFIDEATNLMIDLYKQTHQN
jgi:hypothetical protein